MVEFFSFLTEDTINGTGKASWCSKVEFERGLRAKYSKSDSDCLVQLFETKWQDAGLENGIREFMFVCDKSEIAIFKRNLRLLAKVYGLAQKSSVYFRFENRDENAQIYAEISVHHHIFLHPETFAIQLLDLNNGEKVETKCFGCKFQVEKVINPSRNAFHPDSLTIEQKRRWSGRDGGD